MRKNLFKKLAFIFFGVLLPAVTLIVEQLTEMCAESLNYDPIPTAFHVLAVASVPIVFLTFALVARSKNPNSPMWRFWVGMVTGISIIYAIPFIPLIPFALIGAFFGIGFLLLAPLASAILGFVVLYKMWKSAEPRGWWGSAGILAAFGLLTILALPTIIADNALEKLGSERESERVEAIQTLRTVDADVVEMRLCNYRKTLTPNPISPALSLGHSANTKVAPELFWRITGRKCEVTGWGRGQPDPDRPGLSFASSRLDTSVDAKSATAYTEWLYEVKNSDTFQREADFIVQLPPGGVVSRVTLWVHGEPREATIAGRGQAEHAYKTVVRRSMDPILVTSVGPDRIRVRMFPVPTDQTMRARIGISQPALLDPRGKPTYLFPHVIEGNVENSATHYVWAEASHNITGWKDGAPHQSENSAPDKVRVALATEELSSFYVSAEEPPSPQILTRFEDMSLIQRARVLEPGRLEDLIVVLDTSAGMAANKTQIIRTLENLDPKQFTLILASDKVEVPIHRRNRLNASLVKYPHQLPKRDFLAVERTLSNRAFEGGHDNMPALTQARDMARENSTIVWIHAGQPYIFSGLLTVPERDRLKVYELQVDTKRDVNVDSLHAAGVLEAIPRRGTPGDDLSAWFKQFSEATWSIEREFTLDAPLNDSQYEHLSRIAANEQVFEFMRSGHHKEAVELASDYRIVTPVSAAIVLETQAQYDEFGLERAGNEGVPSIPEPHEWAMIIIGCVALLVAVRKSRNNPQFNMVGA